MIRALYSATTGMNAQQMNIDNISNNLANVNTTGFKKSRIQFQDLLYQTIKEAGTRTGESTQKPVELTVGVGVRPIATQKSFRQGSLTETGNPLDIGINGDGFFKVLNSEGERFYTRDGSFKVNSEGEIVNNDGYFLDPTITVPTDTESVNISPDGIVLAKISGVVEPEEIGQIDLSRFVNSAGLKSIGGNLYEETPASGQPMIGTPNTLNFGHVAQGYLETSNVQLVEEMVNMITAQKAFEINSKVVKTSEAMLQTAQNLKR
ncbi:MAG: flagellar basal-body rod protein FlgG [Candidatus Cloacimonadota bacterium]|nr:flagellar basal-body rod protein FlgG [Candidatus Cloacimonadota bacterium]